MPDSKHPDSHPVLTYAEVEFIVAALVEVGYRFSPMEPQALAIAKKLGAEHNYTTARNFRLERQREENWKRKA